MENYITKNWVRFLTRCSSTCSKAGFILSKNMNSAEKKIHTKNVPHHFKGTFFYPKIMRGARVVVYKWSKYSIQITNMKKHHTKNNSTDSCLALTFNPTAHFFRSVASLHCFVTLAYYLNTYRHLTEKKIR